MNNKEYFPIKKNARKYKFIYICFIIYFLLVIAYCSSKTFIYLMDTYKSKKSIKDISNYISLNTNDSEISNNIDSNIDINTDNNVKKSEEKFYCDDSNVDFKSLKEINSSVRAYLKVRGTNIEYVVTQASDNDYYLYHGFYKEENAAGWVFADFRNKFDGTDKNIIVYGHNMKNGTMFGTLNKVLTDDWNIIKENKYIIFKTENENSIYQVFSVYEIEKESYYITTKFVDNELSKFYDAIKSRSKFNYNINLTKEDTILTLSTCATNNKYRVVLHAKKLNIDCNDY